MVKKETVADDVSSESTITEVSDPMVLRPKELPLVVKGNWKNDNQATYAAILNAYAYRNPTKWAAKKDVLLKQLEMVGKDPGSFYRFAGRPDRIQYSNKLAQ